MLFDDISSLINDRCFININGWIPDSAVSLKVEGISVTGSIKIKPALYMISALEDSGVLRTGKKLIESSSGNLGLALSMICAWKGYPFICVSDPNIAPLTERTIRAYGTNLIIAKSKDDNGGYLGERIRIIESMLKEDQNLIWVNQYENKNNVLSHYSTTGKSILEKYPYPDYVFIGAGTTGTLGGVSSYIRKYSPSTKIIAVDTKGSVTFGGEPSKRRIPGLGTSKAPEIKKYSQFDEIIYIDEKETVFTCRELASMGLLLGGSTGTVLAAVRHYESIIGKNKIVVAISPDMGEKYIDTIYNDDWVNKFYN
ncbi:2,3-diaminopropionate biosynthesis protein SbnA [Xenorhabdus bovienii]|uniref:2,3-diaminopropionate biosynthesis protein SbnA n=1 Tax=Xenorhabdus bovienii TaxID=40576 RepID=UPI0023B33329|nr:2,3-diaminopropionate biosynthesis protein SbnA [Xenorhabdus bovienii]MDE9446336.1 2,3-diaminopropionate biosynthesis protein SbnA [Xenorhabdus bovienii]